MTPQKTQFIERYFVTLIQLQLPFSNLLCLSWETSFSTDDDNDTEVEAVDLETELNLVTECWVEPQSGTVMNCLDQHRHFQGLKYQEIPQAVCTTNLTCLLACRDLAEILNSLRTKSSVYCCP